MALCLGLVDTRPPQSLVAAAAAALAAIKDNAISYASVHLVLLLLLPPRSHTPLRSLGGAVIKRRLLLFSVQQSPSNNLDAGNDVDSGRCRSSPTIDR